MLEPIEGLRLITQAGIKASDDTIKLYASDALKLNAMTVGNHLYLTLVQGNTREVVKYVHTAVITSTANGTIAVTRDVNGGGRKNFSARLCIGFEWNKEALSDLICQTIGSCT